MKASDREWVQTLTGGRYEVERLLAKSETGGVFVGRHRKLGTQVAIKVFAAGTFSGTGAARFRREVALAAHLSHPHIVRLLEFDIHDEVAYLVMPLIQGETLEGYHRRVGRVAYATLRRLLRQIGGALAFAHTRGIVHRDVKPSNILLQRASGYWFLTDFGVARADLAGGRLPTAGAVARGSAYAAPEQRTGGEVDPRSDLYALAAVAYEALTGSPPPPDADPDELAHQVRRERPDLPLRIARVHVAPLAAAPEARPASVRAWLAQIDAAERRSSLRPWTAVFVLGVALAVGWWSITHPPTTSGSDTNIAVLPFQVSGTGLGVALDSLLPKAFTWQLQQFPNRRVLAAGSILRTLRARRSDRALPTESLVVVAREFGASLALSGAARVVRDTLYLNVRLYDTGTARMLQQADTVAAADSLASVVTGLTLRFFARRIYRNRGAWPGSSLPRGLRAIAAYVDAQRAFRRGDYQQSADLLSRVLEADSAHAPSHLKRTLALAAVDPGGTATRQALELALARRPELDPASRLLLDGCEALIRRGDVAFAAITFRDIVARHPDAWEAWWGLGEVLFHFGPMVGLSAHEAVTAFEELRRLDPTSPPALAHLIVLALARRDDRTAGDYMDRYLALDSTSVTADVVRLGRMALQPGGTTQALRSLPARSPALLERLAYVAVPLARTAEERQLGLEAATLLWDRPVTGEARTRAFRLRLAALLVQGRIREATALLEEARARGVDQSELDRWIGIAAVTAMPDLEPDATAAAAMRRMAANTGNALDQWLAARWLHSRDPDQAADVEQHMREAVRASPIPSALDVGLLQDLVALDHLAAGDTAAAIGSWRLGARRVSLNDFPFDLIGSLWPLRLARSRLATTTGRYSDALDASETFLHLGALADQAVWPQVLLVRGQAATALGDTATAIAAYRVMTELLRQADGAGAVARDRALRALQALGGSRPASPPP